MLDVRQPADAPPEVTVGLMGLTGPSGVLPRYYSEVVTQTLRSRSTALRDFLDLLAHRFVAFFARAGIKYRPARAAEAAAQRGDLDAGSGGAGAAGAHRLRHAASAPIGWLRAPSRCCTTPGCSRCARVRPTGWAR